MRGRGGTVRRWWGGGRQGMKPGRGRKTKRACISSSTPSHPRGGGGTCTCSSRLSSSSPLHPLTPPPSTSHSHPSRSPYLHLNSWIQLSTLTLLSGISIWICRKITIRKWHIYIYNLNLRGWKGKLNSSINLEKSLKLKRKYIVHYYQTIALVLK